MMGAGRKETWELIEITPVLTTMNRQQNLSGPILVSSVWQKTRLNMNKNCDDD